MIDFAFKPLSLCLLFLLNLAADLQAETISSLEGGVCWVGSDSLKSDGSWKFSSFKEGVAFNFPDRESFKGMMIPKLSEIIERKGGPPLVAEGGSETINEISLWAKCSSSGLNFFYEFSEGERKFCSKIKFNSEKSETALFEVIDVSSQNESHKGSCYGESVGMLLLKLPSNSQVMSQRESDLCLETLKSDFKEELKITPLTRSSTGAWKIYKLEMTNKDWYFREESFMQMLLESQPCSNQIDLKRENFEFLPLFQNSGSFLKIF